MTQEISNRTAKGERTREHIYRTALALFLREGYHATTMRDVAQAADCSLGLAYRYFASKEDLILTLYREHSAELAAAVHELPAGPLAARFEQIMQDKLARVAPYRELLRSLMGAALSPEHAVGVLSPHTADVRRLAWGTFELVVTQASDAPRPAQARELTTLLYALHLGLLLFWLYDSTPEQRASAQLVRLCHELLTLMRRLLRLPPIARLLSRVVQAIEPVFGPTIV